MTNQHMGIDQYGQTFHALGKRPRKELLARLGRKSARKIYRDRSDGTARHVGWIIGGLWIEVFKVEPLEIRARPKHGRTAK